MNVYLLASGKQNVNTAVWNTKIIIITIHFNVFLFIVYSLLTQTIVTCCIRGECSTKIGRYYRGRNFLRL